MVKKKTDWVKIIVLTVIMSAIMGILLGTFSQMSPVPIFGSIYFGWYDALAYFVLFFAAIITANYILSDKS